MLLLTRKRGEGFQVGENIHIAVLGIEQGNVKIGISAPKDMNIARDELVGRSRKKARVDAEETESVDEPTIA